MITLEKRNNVSFSTFERARFRPFHNRNYLSDWGIGDFNTFRTPSKETI